MSARRISTAFAATLFTIYLALGVPVLLLLPNEGALQWIALAVLHECLALGIAIDLSELLFGLLLPPTVHPRAEACGTPSIRVAVLYLCCDDVDSESLESLNQFRSADVFILDDSQTSASRHAADASGFMVVRRGDRTAYKAGNLNHWLESYGGSYDYFVVLDSDSIITPTAVGELVAYAEAAANRDVAIVQSSILPRAGNRLQRYLSSQHAVRNRILCHLYDAIGWTLSHGHNNLHRTAAILLIGGLDTTATCEDTATSLRLSRHGWRVIFVETTSYDAEPKDILAFRRRHVRWARQTIDVIAAMRLDVGISQGLLMARHVLGYVLPSAGTASIALFLLYSTFSSATWVPARAQVLETAFAYAFVGSLLTIALLRMLLCVRAGQRVGVLLLSSALHSAAVAFCCMHVVVGILQSLVRQRVGFAPTGKAKGMPPTFRTLLYSMAGPWGVYASVGVTTAIRASTVGAVKLFWLGCFVGSPLVLWLFHRDQKRSEEATP